MTSPATNRDLYLAVGALVEQHRSTSRSLEEYLRAMLELGGAYRSSNGLTPSEFLDLLAAAFTVQPAPIDASWFDRPNPAPTATGYAAWLSTLTGQIVDLAEMERDGKLANEYRYFGIDAPRGARWFNFDPCTYIECGIAGTLGGWEEGDSTGREYVPGEVAVLDSAGHVSVHDPRELQEPLITVSGLPWDLLTDFLVAGQQYE